MDKSKLEAQIKKTGFVLENEVAQTLKKAGWAVISNKFYVDDLEENVREIDLIAYKYAKVRHLGLRTVLIISCKKSDSNTWALLTRKNDLADPNFDWWPLHTWSNDRAMEYQIKQKGFSENYHNDAIRHGVREALAKPSVEVFAYQEMDLRTGAPQNDKPIFSAVTSLMKAQAYELGALPTRKKDPSVYQFNLLSVVDAELARLMFTENGIECSEITSEHHFARYIIKKKETFSRVRFIKSEVFSSILEDYDRLHNANKSLFTKAYDEFYKNILDDSERVEAIIADFRQQVSWWIEFAIKMKSHQSVEAKKFSFHLNESKDTVSIKMDLTQDQVDYINSNSMVATQVKKALSEVYKYEGKFKFEVDDIPF